MYYKSCFVAGSRVISIKENGKTRGFLTELGKQVIAYTCDKRSKFFLFQKLGMCIQRGNASSVLSSFPQHKKLEEIFQL